MQSEERGLLFKLEELSVKSGETSDTEDFEEEKFVEDPSSKPEKLTRQFNTTPNVSVEDHRLRKSHTISSWKPARPADLDPLPTKTTIISTSPPPTQTLPRSWTNTLPTPWNKTSTLTRSPSTTSISSTDSQGSPPSPSGSSSSVRRRGTLLPAKEKHKTLRMANNYLDLGKFKEAIEIYNKKLEEDPHNVVALNNKGLALDQIGQFREALDSFKQALEVDPTNSPTLHNKSIALRRLGRVKDAIKCYDKVLEIDPMDAEALNNKGLVLDHMGKFKQALYYYEMALNIDPTHSVALYNKGYALRMLGKFEEAIEAYDEALMLDSSFADCWSNKALALFHVMRFRKAIYCYDQALQLNPNLLAAEHNKRIVLKRITSSIEGKLCLYCRKNFGMLRKSTMCKNCLVHFCRKDCQQQGGSAARLPDDGSDPNLCAELVM